MMIIIDRTTITRKQKWEEKQLYGYFKRQIGEISHEKIWTRLRKGNLKRETLLIVAQNNANNNNNNNNDNNNNNNKLYLIRQNLDIAKKRKF